MSIRLAEMAQRLGWSVVGETHFRHGLALGIADTFLLAAYADFLLDQQRPAEVVALLPSAGQTCPASVIRHLIDDHTDGAYAVLRFAADYPAALEALQVRYALFFDIDPQHKGLLRLQYQGASRTRIFSPEKTTQQFALSKPSKLSQFHDFRREGVWHIWIGFDHILFLLALLLPGSSIAEEKGGGL